MLLYAGIICVINSYDLCNHG